MELRPQGGRAPPGQPVADEGHGQGTSHDEGQRRIPGSGHVQEAQDHRRIGHAGKPEPGAEQEPGDKAGENIAHGAVPHRTCRISSTVSAAVAMTVSVAASSLLMQTVTGSL